MAPTCTSRLPYHRFVNLITCSVSTPHLPTHLVIQSASQTSLSTPPDHLTSHCAQPVRSHLGIAHLRERRRAACRASLPGSSIQVVVQGGRSYKALLCESMTSVLLVVVKVVKKRNILHSVWRLPKRERVTLTLVLQNTFLFFFY